MPALNRQKKITFAEMRATGVRGLLIYCSDYKCSHWTTMSADRWPDDVRLSDLESHGSPAKFAAREVSMSGRTSTGIIKRPDVRRFSCLAAT